MSKSQQKVRGMQSWWLSDLTETCSACSQAYAYHTEIRCIDCDGPMCPICVQVTTRLEFSCPDCFEYEPVNEDQAKEFSK